MLAYEALLIWVADDDIRTWILYYIFHAIGAVGIFAIIYKIFFDLPTARFSFSDEGITMYVGFKKYETRWSEFAYVGILGINVEAVKSIYTSDTF